MNILCIDYSLTQELNALLLLIPFVNCHYKARAQFQSFCVQMKCPSRRYASAAYLALNPTAEAEDDAAENRPSANDAFLSFGNPTGPTTGKEDDGGSAAGMTYSSALETSGEVDKNVEDLKKPLDEESSASQKNVQKKKQKKTLAPVKKVGRCSS